MWGEERDTELKASSGSIAVDTAGLAVLLRSWRARAGQRLGLGGPLPQVEVASELGMSERWYRELERGSISRLDPRVLSRLADVLRLDADERAALHFHAFGGTPYATPSRAARPADLPALRQLVDRQMPRPAYVTDTRWDIVTHNSAMAEWFPWVLARDANLIRWALTSPEAREQLVDWPRHAYIYLAMVRFAMAERPDDPGLSALLHEILQDPACRRLWTERTCIVGNRDGHRFRLRLPHVAPAVIEVVTQVLLPAGHPGLRFVVLGDEPSSPAGDN
ncbi:helix-turn-helix transcriptional regulator [Streptomyces wuyuanensis]|uniref:helix-turn-helix transcriptional regulator n=1 Tax=Streptomyces wuyuanensis TaxID=1196353 RepID=UPI0036943363